MRLALPVLMLLLTAACGGGERAESKAPAACDQQINNDPTVKSIRMKGAAVPEYSAWRQGELDEAIRKARLACERRLGLAPPGGVQMPREGNWYPFGSLF